MPARPPPLLEAMLLPNGVQVSVHEPPRALRRELALVLPDVPLEGVLVVPTCQRAVRDLVNVGPEVAREKDELLERVRHRIPSCNGRLVPVF
jgi:hypothetical protein